MSKNQYLSNSKSPFFAVEDDVDDETFLNHRPTYMMSGSGTYNSTTTNYSTNTYQHNDILEEKRQQLLQKKREIEERTVQSSQRSLNLLRNSEEVGVATAEELLRQREQLERTEKRLDEINTTLRFSQKHIQGIKSVFGSLKNYLSGKTGEPPNPNRQASSISGDSNGSSKSSSRLSETLTQASSSSYSDHPGLQTRGLTESPGSDNIINKSSSAQEVIDQNLDEMVTSIVRLKGLAHGLGEEIETQNDLVENIIVKAEKADITLQRQNKDIKRLLK